MTLAAGTRLGPYEILAAIGAGGMGEVYRARDTKLDRSVALKILPELFAHDPDRLARFEREAKTLASLNHPNIAIIHGFEEASGIQALVMELVEGPTLADRVAQGPMPLDEALPIARQIAEALEAAHEQGIIHRDLKPANIKVRPDGTVKVLDFGLAKAMEAGASEVDGPAALTNSPTMTSPMMTYLRQGHGGVNTQAGVILGTAAYMSPEQARGRSVTKQADIWALGCVCFEMLTGRAAFSGETVSDTLAKILKDEPNWANTSVPRVVRRIVDRCLLKDMRRRFHDAGDVRVEIEEALSAPPTAEATDSRSTSRRPLLLVAALAAIAILLAGVVWLRSPAIDAAPEWSGTLLSGPAIAYGPRVSPDGNTLAFQAMVDGLSQVAVMHPKSGHWTLLTDDRNRGVVSYICWSTDGTRIYFSRDSNIFSVPALGGEPRLLLENADMPEALPDGSLLFQRTNSNRIHQLHRFTPDTGELNALNALLDGRSDTGVPAPRFRVLPGGDQIAFVGTPAELADHAPSLQMLDLKTQSVRRIGGDIESASIFGIGVDPRDGSVLVDIKSADLHQILAISASGSSGRKVLLTLTNRASYLDMAADGTLYLDQIDRPMHAIRFTESDHSPQIKAVSPNSVYSSVLELPDGRLLLTAVLEGRARLVAARPTGELEPFVETEEETLGPATLAGPGQVAFLIGTPPLQSIAIASLKDGRVAKRLKIPAGNALRSLTASSDGAIFFYSDAGSIWSIPATGGDARRLGAGDAVAFDPRSQNLVVQLNESDVARLVRMPVTGGSTQPILTHGELKLHAYTSLGSHAVGRDGRIVVPATSNDSWFFIPAILDPVSGNLRRTPLRYDADFFSFSWNHRNEIVTGGFLLRSSLWRFRPVERR